MSPPHGLEVGSDLQGSLKDSVADRRSFSVKRSHFLGRERGEAAGSAIAVQKLDLKPIRWEQLYIYKGTHVADFDVSV